MPEGDRETSLPAATRRTDVKLESIEAKNVETIANAEKGDADASFNLGQAYRLGRGVPLDLSAAKVWFERAAQLAVFERFEHPRHRAACAYRECDVAGLFKDDLLARVQIARDGGAETPAVQRARAAVR